MQYNCPKLGDQYLKTVRIGLSFPFCPPQKIFSHPYLHLCAAYPETALMLVWVQNVWIQFPNLAKEVDIIFAEFTSYCFSESNLLSNTG